MKTFKKCKLASALTLIEVMAAVLIVTIVIAGGSFLFVMGRNQVALQKHYRVASQLAAQKLEELKAGAYGSIPADETESIPLEDLSYTRSTHTTDANSYKEVTVTVSWGPAGNERNVSLVTCIAP